MTRAAIIERIWTTKNCTVRFGDSGRLWRSSWRIYIYIYTIYIYIYMLLFFCARLSSLGRAVLGQMLGPAGVRVWGLGRDLLAVCAGMLLFYVLYHEGIFNIDMIWIVCIIREIIVYRVYVLYASYSVHFVSCTYYWYMKMYQLHSFIIYSIYPHLMLYDIYIFWNTHMSHNIKCTVYTLKHVGHCDRIFLHKDRDRVWRKPTGVTRTQDAPEPYPERSCKLAWWMLSIWHSIRRFAAYVP